MKRFTKVCAVVLAAGLLMTSLAGCGGGSSSSTDDKTIVVGASPIPHSEILKAAEESLKEKGYTLEIKEFTDYVQPNKALSNGELDANYFQHAPYLTDYNEKNGTDLVSAASIHYEPLGLYAGKTKAVTELSDGATIAVSNDTTNEARALLLLENQGLIKLKEGVGLAATPKDIAENPKNLKVQELEAAQLARSLGDVDMAVINGNYALDADLKVSDALAKEEKDSEAAKTYANIVAVRKGEENSDKTKALIDALKSESVQNYILNTYDGAVVPMD
ncbi:MetQ/NlpA family ABC transporter substrate-binding protein [Eubacterium aggregans]|uniref:MetQ/NlpA family ABC transporter substrate-binding protein n=1 Tax=Eubacterium aggregans TaxID=81409 RepID=UPI003F40749C